MALNMKIHSNLLLLLQVYASIQHLVQNNSRFYSCKTFNDHANDADPYFTSDSSFYFVKGTHHWNVSLIITNVDNLSFVGDESDVILSNGYSMMWHSSSNISFMSLTLLFNDTDVTATNSATSFIPKLSHYRMPQFKNTTVRVTLCPEQFELRTVQLYLKTVGLKMDSTPAVVLYKLYTAMLFLRGTQFL